MTNDVSQSYLSLDIVDAVATITIDRPDKRNAFNTAMWRQLADYCHVLNTDPSVKVVVLRSASTDAFSAGADISEFDTLRKDVAKADANMRDIENAMSAVESLSRPTIAVIDGSCFGGGLALALCCDFRIAGPSARFAITPARLGLSYSLNNVNRLASVAGHQMARRILMLAEVIKPAEALHCNLIDRLADDMAEEDLPAMLGQLLSLSQYSIRSIKQSIVLSETGHFGEQADDQKRLIDAFSGPDLTEGMTAFLQKRKPAFPYS